MVCGSNTCINCGSCSYTCDTCDNAENCTACNSSNFRQMNTNTSQCNPIDGYYDDGLNNSMAQSCDPSCITCFGSVTYCSSCANDTYYLLGGLLILYLLGGQCYLCDSSMAGCTTCDNSLTCTLC